MFSLASLIFCNNLLIIVLVYQKLGGHCLTDDGGEGDYETISHQTHDQCRQRCNEASYCRAYEFDFHLEGNIDCEIHRVGTTTSNNLESAYFSCFIKLEGTNS